MKFNENITRSDLNQLEDYLDRLYSSLGIDVEFTRHFADRANDARNIKDINVNELRRIFKQARKYHGKKIVRLGPESEAVLKDMSSDVNIPFVLTWDKENEELDLVAKTVMRKKNFRTPDPEFTVEQREATKRYLQNLKSTHWKSTLPNDPVNLRRIKELHEGSKPSDGYALFLEDFDQDKKFQNTIETQLKKIVDNPSVTLTIEYMLESWGVAIALNLYPYTGQKAEIAYESATINFDTQEDAKSFITWIKINFAVPNNVRINSNVHLDTDPEFTVENKLTEGRVVDYEGTTFYENPNATLIQNLLSKHVFLRGLYMENNVWVWPAMDMIHNDAGYLLYNVGELESSERFMGDDFDFIVSSKDPEDEIEEWNNAYQVRPGVYMGFYAVDSYDALKNPKIARMLPKEVTESYREVFENGRITSYNKTDDVGYDEIKVQAKKFGSDVDTDGRPKYNFRDVVFESEFKLTKNAPDTSKQEVKAKLDKFKDYSFIQSDIMGPRTPKIAEIAKKHNVDIHYIEKQLQKGIQIEIEHTGDQGLASEIVRDHLNELPDYYTRLEKMEDPQLMEKAFKGNHTTFHVNPSWRQITKIIDDSEGKSLRGFYGTDNNFYFWDAYDLIHQTGAEELGFDYLPSRALILNGGRLMVGSAAEKIAKSPYILHNFDVSMGDMASAFSPPTPVIQLKEEQASRTRNLNESKSAPLYHFTAIERLAQIIQTNTLKGHASIKKTMNVQDHGESVSFTRDYDRQFVPRVFNVKTVALRIDQEKLHRIVGKKMVPTTNTKAVSEKEFLDQLDDQQKKRYAEIKQEIKNGNDVDDTMRWNGISPVKMAKGQSGYAERFESEERVKGDVPNVDQLITGIVLSGKRTSKVSMDDLVEVLVNEFKGRSGFEKRGIILETAIKLGVPLIWKRTEFDPKQVKSAVIKVFQARKKARNER